MFPLALALVLAVAYRQVVAATATALPFVLRSRWRSLSLGDSSRFGGASVNFLARFSQCRSMLALFCYLSYLDY
jgi:hypothetical protein